MDNNLILYNNGQYELSFIEHNVEEVTINQRAFDGYINATALCKACNKLLSDFREYFHNEWLKKRAIEYFKKKDEKAVKFIAEHIKKLN